MAEAAAAQQREPRREAGGDDPAHRPFARGLGSAVALGAAVTFLFFLPALSPSRQFGYFDDGRMHLPMKRYLADEFRAGHLPEWNPYSGLGTPIIAGGVDSVLHPFNVLFLGLPFELAFKLWVLLFYPIAAAGAFAWARRLGAGFAGAATAGVAFTLSGYAVSLSGNMQYLASLALFPWMLAAAHAFVERPGPGRGALVALASGLCAAGGDPQGWGIALTLVPVAVLVFPPREGIRRGLLRATGVIALGVAGAAPSLFPTLLWISNSGRAEPFDAYEYEHFNLLPARALELVIPHLFRTSGRHLASELYEAYSGNRLTPFPWALSQYVGVTVVALAVLGAVRRRAARVLVGAAAIFTWMAMGPRGGFGQIARALPVLSSLRYWEKVAVWPALLLAIAAAFGVGVLLRSPVDARRFGRALAIIGLVLLASAGAAALAPGLISFAVPPGAPDLQEDVARNLGDGLLHAGVVALLFGAVSLLAARSRLSYPAIAVVAVCTLDVAAANVRAYVLYDVEFDRPRSPVAARLAEHEGLQRITTPFGMFFDARRHDVEMETAWRVGANALYAAWNVPWHIANFEIYSGMRPVRSNRFWRRTGRKDRLPDLGVWGFQWVWVPPDAGPGSIRFLPADRIPEPLPDGAYGTLYRIPARPRVYLAGSLESVTRRAAMEFALQHDKVAGGHSVVEGPVPDDYVPPAGSARLTVDRPERLEIEVVSDARALLVVNDEFTVGWTAVVDGAPAEIVPVNYLARGIWVQPGVHRVHLAYRTPGLLMGTVTALAAGLVLAGWALTRRSRSRSSFVAT